MFPLGGLGRDLKTLQTVLQELPPGLMNFYGQKGIRQTQISFGPRLHQLSPVQPILNATLFSYKE